MSADWPSFLLQLPVVAIFIWYSLQMQKNANEMQTRYLDALDKRDAEYEKRNQAVVEALGNVAKELSCHDENVRARVEAIVAAVRNMNRNQKREGQ